MANIKKTFNFRNGVQVDDDNLVVNTLGLVGIGTSIPTESLDVRGTAKVIGLMTATEVNASSASFTKSVDIGNAIQIDANSGVVTATKFFGDASGLTNIYAIAVDGWIQDPIGLSTFANIGLGTTSSSSSKLLVIGDTVISGILTASEIYGSGVGISSLNASEITFGVLDVNRLPSNVEISGIVSASHFSGNSLSISGISTFVVINSVDGVIDYLSNLNFTSGISTISTLNASTGFISTITSLNLNSNVGSISSLSSPLFSSGFSTITNAYIGVATVIQLNSPLGNLTSIQNTNINTSGIGTINTLNASNAVIGLLTSTTATINTLSSSNAVIVIGTINQLNSTTSNLTSIENTNINTSGVGTINTLNSTNATVSSLNCNSAQVNTLTSPNAIITVATVDQLNSLLGNLTSIENTNINTSGIGTINTLKSSDGTIGILSATTATINTLTSSNATIDNLTVTQSSSQLVTGNQFQTPNITIGTNDISVSSGNLYVNGITTSTGGFVGNLTGNVSGTANVALDVASSANLTISSLNVTGTISAGSSITGAVIRGTDGYYTGILTSFAIGIKTDNPQSDLHIFDSPNASLQITGQNESTLILGKNISQTQRNSALRFGNTSGSFPYSTSSSFDIINYDNGNFNNYLHLGSISGINTGNFNWFYSLIPLMTLTYAGNLGIGTTQPYNSLTVSGVGTFTDSLFVGNNLNVTGPISANSSITGAVIRGTDGYYTGILTSGAIGIQTDNPQSDLHIVNSPNVSLQLTGQNESILIFGRSFIENEKNALLGFGNTSRSLPYSTSSSFDIINYDNGNFNNYLHLGSISGINTGNFNWFYGKNISIPLMTLTYAGNLGIGTTQPYNSLTVSGVGTFTDSLFVGNNLNVIGDIRADDIISSSITSNLTGNVNATSGVSTFTNLSSIYGNVGFLTTSNLEVSAIFSADPTLGVQIGDQSTFDTVVVSTASTIGIATNLIIGINTSNILVGYQINNDEYPDIFPNLTIVTSIGINQIGIGTTTANEIEINNVPLSFGFPTNSNNLIKITTTGNLGIGTINPTAKLDVRGNVNVTGVSTFAGITTVTGNTLFTRQINSSGISTFTDLRVGTGITANSGIITAVNGFHSGIGTAVQITTIGDQLIFTVPGVGSTSFTLY